MAGVAVLSGRETVVFVERKTPAAVFLFFYFLPSLSEVSLLFLLVQQSKHIQL